MAPVLSTNDPTDLALSEPEMICQGLLGHRTGRIERSDAFDYLIRDDGSSSSFSRRAAPVVTPATAAFHVSIADIVSLSPEKQMGWIYAPAVVAAMEHAKTSRDCPVRQFKCNTMSLSRAIADTNCAIPAFVGILVDVGHPRPTLHRIGYLDLGPEAR